jgi:hypothetical protein
MKTGTWTRREGNPQEIRENKRPGGLGTPHYRLDLEERLLRHRALLARDLDREEPHEVLRRIQTRVQQNAYKDCGAPAARPDLTD